MAKAKTATKTPNKPASVPATVKPGALANTMGVDPALQAMMLEDAGEGVSMRQEDSIVPMVYVLQAQSPQAVKRNPNYLEGAEAGCLWLRNAPDPIVHPDAGFDFQPCYFFVDWVEWIPRDTGGGFIARYATEADIPDDAELVEDEKNPAKKIYRRANGNEVIETRYYVGIVYRDGYPPMPYVIPFTSSGHSVAKAWMFTIRNKQMGGSIAPIYASLFHITTRFRTNTQGEWYSAEILDKGFVPTAEMYAAGKTLHYAFKAGDKAVENPDEGLSDMGGDEAM